MGWTTFALGSAFFAGLTAILAKVGVRDVPSNQATLVRVVVMLPMLIALVLARHEWMPLSSLPSRSLLFLVLSALGTGLSWLCYFRALQLGPASLVSPIDKLSLVVSVVLAAAFLGERLSGIQWAGAALMAAGAVLIALH